MEEIIRTPKDPSASGGAVANSPPSPGSPTDLAENTRRIQPIPGGEQTHLEVSQKANSANEAACFINSRSSQPYPVVEEQVSKPPLNPISRHRSRIGRRKKSLGKIPIDQRPQRRLHLSASGLCACHAMAPPQLRSQERSGGSSPADRRITNEGRAFRSRDLLHVRPEIVDAKTRSKWSRTLRFAARTKPEGQRLTDFIKSYGGLNGMCAQVRARVE